MYTAVITYGSLANQLANHGVILEVERPYEANPSERYNLNIFSPFVPADGLTLPVELGRESSVGESNRRITMTIQNGAPQQQAFYAISRYNNLNDSIKNLREREGTISENISYMKNLNRRNCRPTGRYGNAQVAEKIASWATSMGFDGVIWTELPTNRTKRQILQRVQEDALLKINTQAYIRNLPFIPLQRSSLQQEILNM